MLFKIFKSEKDDPNIGKDDEKIKTRDRDGFPFIKDHLQRHKDIYDCLNSDACIQSKTKLLDCLEKTNKEVTRFNENCNKEIIELMNCVKQCAAKKDRKRVE
ncbi:UCR_hinge domain-containing protein [Nephila pilipes]|uniref:UCR_hinge domain-containing protein n=1 Tax=Nephila pilipes TaxID=299642 RepID=A0A8X6MFK6_NEPPI|nr:UCR_hinge domain-containing protein [Nephila pilipes]